MARNGKNKKRWNGRNDMPPAKQSESRLHPDTKKSVLAIAFFCAAVILALARFHQAGPLGDLIYKGLDALFGWGYFILPTTLVFAAAVFIFAERRRFLGMTLIGGTILIFSVLGLIELLAPHKGGALGLVLGSLRIPFGNVAAIVINGFIFIVSILVTANIPLKIKWPEKRDEEEGGVEEEELMVTGAEETGAGQGTRDKAKTPKKNR